MTDLGAVIAAAEKVRDSALVEALNMELGIMHRLTKASVGVAFGEFVDHLKAMEKGIYG